MFQLCEFTLVVLFTGDVLKGYVVRGTGLHLTWQGKLCSCWIIKLLLRKWREVMLCVYNSVVCVVQ
jgi:hypothetical protein